MAADVVAVLVNEPEVEAGLRQEMQTLKMFWAFLQACAFQKPWSLPVL